MAKSISDLLDLLDKVSDDLEEMEHIPQSKINMIQNKIDDIVSDLEECSTEYGDEKIENDEEDEDY
jgi:hypothetical protein